jgi:hypothetical protein
MLLTDLHPATHVPLIFTVLAVKHSSEMLPRGFIIVPVEFAAVAPRRRGLLSAGLVVVVVIVTVVEHHGDLLCKLLQPQPLLPPLFALLALLVTVTVLRKVSNGRGQC